jgi:putative hemolysin
MRIKQSDLKTLIESKSPGFFQKLPGFLSNALLWVFEQTVHVDELVEFFTLHGDKLNWQFIEAIFAYLKVSYVVPEADRHRIPATGRLICVANHATGPLDGLILLHLIGSVRTDVKIILTDLLAGLDNLSDLFLVYDQYSSRLQKQNIQAIRQAILAEQAVIFFPAGEVTKLTRWGIREQTWQTGPVALACKYGVPILPVAIHARNSWLYYLVALLHRNLSTMMLSHEMFRKRSRTIPVTIGGLLPATRLTAAEADVHAQSQQLRKYVHQLSGPDTFC